jgi:hypothetical protein
MTPAPELAELIATVVDDAPDESPLARLATASGLSSELTDTADAVLGHFVDVARRSGHSWSEIGDALGVSKQAAQQRHVARTSAAAKEDVIDVLGGFTFERFTDRARTVVALSESLARDLGHDSVGSEHLLLAQYSVPEGLAAKILNERGVTREAVLGAVMAQRGRGPGAPEGRIAFKSDAVRALSLALAAALELGHNYIGTEHLLLGTVRADGGDGAWILRDHGLSEVEIRPAVLEKLAGFLAGGIFTPEKAAGKKAVSKEAAAKKAAAKKAAPKKAAPKKAAGKKSAAKKARPGS